MVVLVVMFVLVVMVVIVVVVVIVVTVLVVMVVMVVAVLDKSVESNSHSFRLQSQCGQPDQSPPLLRPLQQQPRAAVLLLQLPRHSPGLLRPPPHGGPGRLLPQDDRHGRPRPSGSLALLELGVPTSTTSSIRLASGG